MDYAKASTRLGNADHFATLAKHEWVNNRDDAADRFRSLALSAMKEAADAFGFDLVERADPAAALVETIAEAAQ